MSPRPTIARGRIPIALKRRFSHAFPLHTDAHHGQDVLPGPRVTCSRCVAVPPWRNSYSGKKALSQTRNGRRGHPRGRRRSARRQPHLPRGAHVHRPIWAMACGPVGSFGQSPCPLRTTGARRRRRRTRYTQYAPVRLRTDRQSQRCAAGTAHAAEDEASVARSIRVFHSAHCVQAPAVRRSCYERHRPACKQRQRTLFSHAAWTRAGATYATIDTDERLSSLQLRPVCTFVPVHRAQSGQRTLVLRRTPLGRHDAAAAVRKKQEP